MMDAREVEGGGWSAMGRIGFTETTTCKRMRAWEDLEESRELEQEHEHE
jgi:hypothetical protein